MTSTSGRFHEQDGTAVVSFERVFAHSVAEVWRAVTDRAQLEAWFPTSVELEAWRPGARITFRFAEDAYPAMHGEVLAVTPERELGFTWGEDTLAFALEPVHGDRCRLTLTVVMPELGKAARDSAGWERCLDILDDSLAGTPSPRGDDRLRWQTYYDAYVAGGVPATAEIPTPQS